MHLIIIHYHLHPGGVTGVIKEAIEALATHSRIVKKITLVAGSSKNIPELKEAIEKNIDSQFPLSLKVIHEFGYADVDSEEFSTTVIRNKLLKLYDNADTVLWVHNYHLGKNPHFTQSLLSILKEHSKLKAVFHIHDFPECGRYNNLKFLIAHVSAPIYPVQDNIRYCVINSRDRDILIRSGLPENNVFLLHNPYTSLNTVNHNENEDRKNKSRKNEIFEIIKKQLPGLSADAPLHLFPVRCIRRKNVLEAALLSHLINPESVFCVTLPGVSVQEKSYSDMIEAAYKDGIINGVWQIGDLLKETDISFHDLLRSADAVLSSSVQEGFGYLFVQSVDLDIPLIARYLDILDGISEVFNDRRTYFYQSLFIPLELFEEVFTKTDFLEKYDKKLENQQDHLPKYMVEKLRENAKELIWNGLIDFSYLSTEHQLVLLKRIKKQNKRDLLISSNKELMGGAANTMKMTASKKPAVLSAFEHKTHVATIEKVLSSFSEQMNESEVNLAEISQKILYEFATMPYQRLIYE